MKFDLFKLIEKVPNKNLQNRILDKTIDWFIPFNKNLNFHIKNLEEKRVVIESPPVRRRKNHVGGAHACALALLGEYPAGILIARHYNPENFRFIIANLSVNYFRQGHGILLAETFAPEPWPSPQDGQAWIEMKTLVTNEKNQQVAEIITRWQVKEWKLIKDKRD